MIATQALVKYHDGTPILQGVSLEIAKGEVAAIIGPSGSGKSTFLRCLNGLEPFQQGWVRVGKHRLNAEEKAGQAFSQNAKTLLALRRQVGFVFQQFHLFPHLTVLENLMEAPVQVLGKSREESAAKAFELLDRVGLKDKANALPRNLSGGQQQRVAIMRALAMEPQAMLFDEPTSALDPLMSAEVLAVLTDLASEGMTMAVVTHQMGFARRVADRVYVFVEGHLAEEGSPEKVFSTPEHPTTQAFLKQALHG